MAKIGDITNSGFTVDPGADGVVAANKFTAPSTFTPDKILINFQEAFGDSGTVYVACYADNAGVPGAKLFNGSTAYASLFNGTKTISVTGTELTNGTAYWLAAYWDSSGTFNVDVNAEDSATNQNVLTWTETPGSWTDSPSTSSLSGGTDRDIAIEANDETATTSTSTTSTSSSTSRTTSTSTTSTSSSTSTSTTSTSSSVSTSTSTTSTSSSTTMSITTSTSTTSTSTTSTSSSTSVSTSTSSSTTMTIPYGFVVGKLKQTKIDETGEVVNFKVEKLDQLV